MTRVFASVDIDAPVDVVWAVLEPIESHAEWMADAESIEFVGEQTRGLGTTFIAHTKVGPIRLADHMEITMWEPDRAMGVRHVGIVTGSGAFTLESIDVGRRTRMIWDERLRFPWYLGGGLGGVVGARILAAIWRGNLKRLRASIEASRCAS